LYILPGHLLQCADPQQCTPLTRVMARLAPQQLRCWACSPGLIKLHRPCTWVLRGHGDIVRVLVIYCFRPGPQGTCVKVKLRSTMHFHADVERTLGDASFKLSVVPDTYQLPVSISLCMHRQQLARSRGVEAFAVHWCRCPYPPTSQTQDTRKKRN
jgi:hypothetical protein